MSTPLDRDRDKRARVLDRQDSVPFDRAEELRAQLERHTPHAVVEEDWCKVIRHIPVDLEASARENLALLRARGVPSAQVLLRLALAYALCDWSLRIVAAWAALKGWADLSDSALMWRLAGARSWLGELVGAMVIRNRRQIADHQVRLKLIDASVINGPGSKGTDWRLHASLELGRVRFDELEITDSKGAESLERHAAGAEDILVADAGYGHANGMGRVLASGAKLLVRITFQNIRLYDEEGSKLELLEWLRGLPEADPVEREVSIQTEDGAFPMRLIARRLGQEAAEAARRRMRQRASRNGYTPNKLRLEAAGYILVLSNLDGQVWSARQIMALYRLRWQVEMAFKRLKGVLALDHLRARDPDLVQSYLLAKLLGALLVDFMSQSGPCVSIDWFDSTERPVSPWRWLVLFSDALRRAVQGSMSLSQLLTALPRLKRYLCDPPRRRKQQYSLGRRLIQLLIGMSGAGSLHADQLLQPMALC